VKGEETQLVPIPIRGAIQEEPQLFQISDFSPLLISRVASAPLDSFTLALSLDWIGLKLTASILRERFAAFVLDGF
jgi:hypothetical protein